MEDWAEAWVIDMDRRLGAWSVTLRPAKVWVREHGVTEKERVTEREREREARATERERHFLLF